jgi:squalene-hopene/tetraprenyl-beta-curcumene cyclase
VEETALAVEALLVPKGSSRLQPALATGLQWLVNAVLTDRHRENAPIGFYFAKLWYYERLYPLTFAVAALGRAVRRVSSTTMMTE